MFDMMKMMGQIKKTQELVKKAQEELKNISETSESGAGLVKATVNGKKEVISIEINDSIINKKDKKITQDLIVAAINKAIKDVDFKSKEYIKSKTKDIIPDIPGFDIGNIFK
tara:strand:+ start:316 stop:651 length:336 start_codon:yes stop_codon:yes gene_type:complete